MNQKKIHIEVWSDFICPFCYIGKRHFEDALSQFRHKDRVTVTWRSFQLDPEMEKKSDQNIYEMLAAKKGQSLEWSKKVHRQVTAQAKAAGLNYDFDHAIPTNTFDAHRISHLAKKFNLQDRAEERLFSAYFTEGKDIGEPDSLQELGIEIGLDPKEVGKVLVGTEFASDVIADQDQARNLGINGVPLFLFNNKYAVSGAQPVEVFSNALNMVFEEQNALT